MQILQVNKFSHIIGGVDRYFFSVSCLLQRKRHIVRQFSTWSKETKKTKLRKYFIPEYDYSQININTALFFFIRMIYSPEARQRIKNVLDFEKWDIVHLHEIFHHLSPSILPEIKKRNIPIVQTLSTYHLISPNYNMFHHGKICEVTKPNKFYKAIFHKCVKNSYLVSIAEVIEKYIHYWLGWERNYIDYFIAPSLFMKKKLLEYGINLKKIIHLPYFIDFQEYKPDFSPGNYLLYFGRLSPEKAPLFLLEVIAKLPYIKLLIVGRGILEKELKGKKKELGIKNVEFLGFKDGYELKKLIRNSRFTVLPSLWYEVAPISLLESFALGKPVIASRIGGIPEIVKDGFNGFLFKPGNIDDCVEKINKLWSNPILCRRMGKNAREYIEKNFSPEEHYERLMEVYKRALKNH